MVARSRGAKRPSTREPAGLDHILAGDDRVVHLGFVVVGDGAHHPLHGRRTHHQGFGREKAHFLADGLALVVGNPIEEIHAAVVDVLVLIHVAVDHSGNRGNAESRAQVLEFRGQDQVLDVGVSGLVFAHLVAVAVLGEYRIAQAACRRIRNGSAGGVEQETGRPGHARNARLLVVLFLNVLARQVDGPVARLPADGGAHVEIVEARVVAGGMQVFHVAVAGRERRPAAREQLVVDGHVADHAVFVTAVVADRQPDLGHAVLVGLFRDDVDCAPGRVAAEVGALGPAQDLDAFDVVQGRIGAAAGHEGGAEIIDEIADSRPGLDQALVAAVGQVAQSTNRDIAVLVALLIVGRERNIGRHLQEVPGALEITAFDLLRGKRRNADRHVLQGLLAALRGHDDLFERLRAVFLRGQ